MNLYSIATKIMVFLYVIYFQGIFYLQNGLSNKNAHQHKKSSKTPIRQTNFDFGGNSRLWNTEFEKTWELLKSNVDVSTQPFCSI